MREYDLEALAENAQYDLFHNSCSTNHCLNQLYTANRKPAGSMQLRHSGHSFALPIQYTSNLIKDTSSLVYCLTTLMCVTYRPILNSLLISITLCVSFVMFLLCKQVRQTCGFNKLMMIMMMMMMNTDFCVKLRLCTLVRRGRR